MVIKKIKNMSTKGINMSESRSKVYEISFKFLKSNADNLIFFFSLSKLVLINKQNRVTHQVKINK